MTNKHLYASEVRYVCSPNNYRIVMRYHPPGASNWGDYASISFFENQSLSFTYDEGMKFPTKREHFDNQLSHVLYTIFSNYNKDEFQSFVLNGDIQGLQIYNNISSVRNTMGTVIWEK